MKTTAKQLTSFGNLGIVQIMVDPKTTFEFKPGGPELKSGGLIITESTAEGVVGKLIAENNTASFLLLTDADVLIGARQNRIINKSILIAPMSKTVLDVSCVERLRWQYTSRNFSSHDKIAEHDLRKEKAASIALKTLRPEEVRENTQSTVWSHISFKMADDNFKQKTESYSKLIDFRTEKSANAFPVCEPEKGCNGVAVFMDGKVSCIDIFGTEDVYRHYFNGLRDSAFRMAKTGKDIKPVDISEAYYKVLDMIDNHETAERKPEPSYTGAGSFYITDTNEMTGFDLNIEGQLIHNVVFSK